MFYKFLLLLPAIALIGCSKNQSQSQQPVTAEPTQQNQQPVTPSLREDWISIAATDNADGVWIQKSPLNTSGFWHKLVFQVPNNDIQGYKNVGAIISWQKVDCIRGTFTPQNRAIYNWDGQFIGNDDPSTFKTSPPQTPNTIGGEVLRKVCD